MRALCVFVFLSYPSPFHLRLPFFTRYHLCAFWFAYTFIYSEQGDEEF